MWQLISSDVHDYSLSTVYGYSERAGYGWSDGGLLLVHGRTDLEDVLAGEVCLVTEGAEDRAFSVEECKRSVELSDASCIHDEDAVVVH